MQPNPTVPVTLTIRLTWRVSESMDGVIYTLPSILDFAWSRQYICIQCGHNWATQEIMQSREGQSNGTNTAWSAHMQRCPTCGDGTLYGAPRGPYFLPEPGSGPAAHALALRELRLSHPAWSPPT